MRMAIRWAAVVTWVAVVTLLACAAPAGAQAPATQAVSTDQAALDRRVTAFLDRMRFEWRDLNVPLADGQALYDIIVKNNYKSALEIGTSTGHSAIWIAWALSKTGGKLVTVEIDERRHKQALENFREAGVAAYIDARLADAHELVPKLEGPFDFVFIDADKEWYTNYARAVIPRLTPGGCMAAHNVLAPGRSRAGGARMSGTAEYYEFMRARDDFETTVLERSSAGLAVSYKKK